MNDIIQNRIEKYSGVIELRKVNIYCKSNIGARNIEIGAENQDTFEARVDDNYIVVAVADGLGSCDLSKTGANQAVKLLCDWVGQELVEFKEIDNDIGRILCNRIIDRWKKTIGEDFPRYDTTLLFFIYIKETMLIGGIGDGILLLDLDGGFRNLSLQDKIFSNQTPSIGSTKAKEEFRVDLIRDVKINDSIIAVIATDGIADDIDEHNQEKLVAYIKDFIIKRGFEEATKEIDQWVDNWKSLHNSDDKTIAIIQIKEVNDES